MAEELDQPGEEGEAVAQEGSRFLNQKPGQDSQVDHHVDRRIPLTAQDLSRGLGGLRKELQLGKQKGLLGAQKGCEIPANNLELLVTIWTLDAILYLFDGEQGRLLVLLQGAEKRRFTRRSDLESHLKAKSSSGPTFLLLDSMSSFLFFRSSTDTCAIHHIRDERIHKAQQPHSFFFAVRHCPCLCS